mgnify:CR=1 FL=1
MKALYNYLQDEESMNLLAVSAEAGMCWQAVPAVA